MESKEQLVRDKILRIHHENKDLSHRSIAKTLGIANSTVSRVIKRFEERLTGACPHSEDVQICEEIPGLASHLHVREAECTFRDPGHDERTGVHERVPPEAAASSPEGPQRPNNLLAGFGLMPLLQGRAEVVCGQ